MQGRLKDAVGWWRSALRIDQFHQSSHAALAKYYADINDMELAAKHGALSNLSVPAAFVQAWQYLEQGNVHPAQQLLKMTADNSNYEAYAAILNAAIMNKEGHFQEALEELRPALRSDELRIPATVVEAEALHGLGDSLEGLRILNDLLIDNPDLIEAHRALAAIYVDLEAANVAKDHLLKIAELDQNDPRPFRILGQLRKEYDIFDRAIVCYQESLRRNPNQPDREQVLLELADCLIRVHDFDGAGAALEQGKPSLEHEALMAEYLFSLGRTAEAVKRVDLVLKENPNHVRGLLLRADLHLVEQENDEAAALQRRAAELNPFDYEIHRKYGTTLQRIGDGATAVAELARSDELKQLRGRFAELRDKALQPPYDAQLLRELSAVAEQFGRANSAKTWRQLAQALESKSTAAP
jgi:tetratricopeptide (TPR) repeat protein